MKKFYYKFSKIVFALFVFSSISCTNSDGISNSDNNNNGGGEIIVEPTPLVATQILNVSYGSSPQQKYDIYLPAGRSKETTKVFILIHGGSWITGDKSDMNNFVDYLKPNFPNHAIVNINYRLATPTTPVFPMQMDDIKSIVSDLKAKEETYQINNNYGFIGASAGAHLAMLYSYNFDTNDEVSLVCSIVGPTNLVDPNYLDNPDFAQQLLGYQLIFGQSFEDNPSYYEGISPYYVATTSAPPSILFYGDQDHLIPTSQGVDMHAKLNDLGIINQFTLYEGEGHGNWSNSHIQETYNKLSNFINTYFE